jgi:cytoskeletal protein RodZ
MADFGAKLRGARERRGISLREIETKTKVSIAALESLERNDVSRLPGGIFARSVVRAYAAEVGLDPDATVREFTDRFNLDAPPSLDASGAAPEGDRLETARLRATVLVTILLATLVLAAILLLLTLSKAPDDQSNRPAPDRRAAPVDRSAQDLAPGRAAAKRLLP